MEAKDKLKVVAAIGAILVTIALFGVIGPLGQALSHGFFLLSSETQARVASFVRIFASSAPAVAAVVAVTVAKRQRTHSERNQTASAQLGRHKLEE